LGQGVEEEQKVKRNQWGVKKSEEDKN